MKLYYFYTLKALRDCLGKISMYYGMSRVKKQLSRKTPITVFLTQIISRRQKNADAKVV